MLLNHLIQFQRELLHIRIRKFMPKVISKLIAILIIAIHINHHHIIQISLIYQLPHMRPISRGLIPMILNYRNGHQLNKFILELPIVICIINNKEWPNNISINTLALHLMMVKSALCINLFKLKTMKISIKNTQNLSSRKYVLFKSFSSTLVSLPKSFFFLIFTRLRKFIFSMKKWGDKYPTMNTFTQHAQFHFCRDLQSESSSESTLSSFEYTTENLRIDQSIHNNTYITLFTD